MTQYDLQDDEANRRLREFDLDDPGSLRRELALCRMMLEQAAAGKQMGLSVALLSTIGRLAAQYNKAEARKNTFLHRGALLRIANDLISIIADELREVPDFESKIDRINQGLVLRITSEHNTEQEIKDA